MNRQKMLYIALLAVLVLAVLYALLAFPRQQRVTAGGERLPVAATAAGGKSPADGSQENRLQLERLERGEATFPGVKRDLFRTALFVPPLPLPPPLPPLPVAVAPPPPPPPPPEASEEVQLRQELARFTFLGYLLKDGRKTIFLSAGEDIFVVKKGDRFGTKNEFLVTDLSPEKLTVQQGSDPRPLIIPLVDQAPLVPAAGRLATPLGRAPVRTFRPRVIASPPAAVEPGTPAEPAAEAGAEEAQPFPVEQPPADGEFPPPEPNPGEVPND